MSSRRYSIKALSFKKGRSGLLAVARGNKRRAAGATIARAGGKENAVVPVRKLTIRNSNPNQLVAQRFRTKLRYGEWVVLTVPTNVTTSVSAQYLINSIFAPSASPSAHQPLGRDQLALLYSKYRVHNVSYSVQALPAATPVAPVVMTVQQRNDNTLVSASLETIIEQPFTTTKIMSSVNPTIISGRLSNATLAGMTKAEFEGEDGTFALFGNSPTEVQCLNVAFTNTGVGPAGTTVNLRILLEFDVECFDPIVLAPS